MKEWTFDQIILAPGGAKRDLDLRKQELEVLRAENARLRQGVALIAGLKVGTLAGIKRACDALLDEGGA